MKRFTLTIAMIAITVIAFGQKIGNQVQFSKTSPTSVLKYMPSDDDDLDKLVVHWEELFKDSVNGTNGLPETFSYTPTSTDYDDQWHWRKHGKDDGEIGHSWTNDHAIKESFTTDAHTVPSNNPALFVNFMCSYYWMITKGHDSVYVEYSIDNGSSWNYLWCNRNQSDIENSGVDWPYPNWVFQTARIKLPATTIGQSIMFKFNYDGQEGNGFYIDDMSIVEMPHNDISMPSVAVLNTHVENDTTYLDGLYQLLPVSMKRNFEYGKASVKNYGTDNTTNLVFKTTYTAADGTLIAQKDTNAMKSGATDLTTIYAKDTFLLKNSFFDNIDAVTEGTYTLKSSVYGAEQDEDSTGNEFSIDITYDAPIGPNVETHLARNTDITGSIAVNNYSGSNDGDMLGISFHVFEECSITGAIIPLGSKVDESTGFTAYLYLDGDSVEQIASSDDVYTSGVDTNAVKTVSLINPVNLYPGKTYLLMVASHFSGSSKISFGNFKGYKDFTDNSLLYRAAGRLHIGQSWYYITRIPSFTVILSAPLKINNLEINKNTVKVYPNPTNGLLHINNVRGATIEIYNMLGSLVKTINNASEMNTVDLSNYNNGTYLIKVYSENGVVVKKVNLVK